MQKAIRGTGGDNVTRVIAVAPNGQGNQSMLDKVYPGPADLPGGGQDPYLMVTVHTYDPWNFCGQDGTLANKPSVEALLTTAAERIRTCEEIGRTRQLWRVWRGTQRKAGRAQHGHGSRILSNHATNGIGSRDVQYTLG